MIREGNGLGAAQLGELDLTTHMMLRARDPAGEALAVVVWAKRGRPECRLAGDT